GGDLADGGDAVLLVARVDALGAVAGKEVLVEPEAGVLFEDGNAVFLGSAGVHRGFVDDDVALLEHLADGFTGLDQRAQGGPLVLVDGRGDGDDVDVAGSKVGGAGAAAQAAGLAQFSVGDLQRGIVTGIERANALLIDVEAEDLAVFGEFNRQRQADVTEADD